MHQKIHFERHGDQAAAQFLEDRLYEFNVAQTGRSDGRLFTFLIRDGDEAIVAGASGWTWAGACELRTLWVDGAWRGQGLGQQLLAAVEAEARAQGCRAIFLASYSFQAPAFYQRQGYEWVWQLADFPPDHQFNFLIKRLDSIAEQADEAARPT